MTNQSLMLEHCEMNATNITSSIILTYSYYFDGILVTVFGFIGLIGNIFTLVILKHPKFKSCFYQLLHALACFDTLFILFGGIKYVFRGLDLEKNIFIILFPFLIHPFAFIGMSGSIFMTVAISIERFLGICFPFKFPTSTRKAWFYIAPVCIISIGINIPRFFDAVLIWEEGQPIYQVTPFRTSESYIRIYQTYFNISFSALLPLFTMVLINIRIILTIRNVKIKRFRCKGKLQKEVNLYFILLIVVSIFFMLFIPRVIVDIYEFLHIEDIIACRNNGYHFMPTIFIRCLIHVSHFTSIVNSSINFFIYCFVGKTFQQEIFRLTGCSSWIRSEENSRKYQSISMRSVERTTETRLFIDILNVDK